MICAAYEQNVNSVIEGGVALKFMQREWPESVLVEFANVCIAVLEPLAKSQPNASPDSFNSEGEYCWNASDLPARIAKRAAVFRY